MRGTPMNNDKIRELVNQGESHHLEFKKTTGSLRVAFETICGFLNSDGGTILFGITDKGKIIGHEVTDKIQQSISHEISKIEPPTPVTVQYIPIKENHLSV